MKTKSRSNLTLTLFVLVMALVIVSASGIITSAAGSVRVDFCLTNGSLENNVFFENDPTRYFMTQTTKEDGTLVSLESLYRTDNLDLEFDGWYTVDGEKVTLDTVFTEYTIIYDRWKETTLSDENIISTLELNTPLLEVGKLAGTYDTNSITLTDNRLSVQNVSVYEGLNAYRTNKLEDSDVLETGKSYSLRVELHTKNGELIDDQLMSHSTATYGLVANMVYSHDNSGIFTTQWTNRENKIQVIINYDYENYYFTSDLEDKVVENGQSPQYTVYVSNNANIQCMELFVKNANDTWASLGEVTGQFNVPANSNIVKQYRVEVTYQNGFVISSNTFKVDWYDPNSPKFITQPTDYNVANGTNVQVSWALNFDSSSIKVEIKNGETWVEYQSAYNTGTTINSLESGTYTFRAHATKNGNNYYSEEFTITWREKFVFTTQPQSVTVSTGESAIVTWETNLAQTSLQTLIVFQLQTDTGSGWNHSANLAENATSYNFGVSDFAYSQKYRLMANYDGVLYYSDEFTIEYIAGEFTKQPDREINAIVGKDCLVEWEFNLNAAYYDILWYNEDGFDQYDRVYQPEYAFNENSVGRIQFLIEAYNENHVKIGQSELFDIIWTEQQIVYLVSFNANGGTGTMQPVEQSADSQYTLPDCGFSAPDGKTFKAWSVNDVEKNVGDKITIEANTIIKAVWEEIPIFIVAYGPGEGIGSTEFEYVEEGSTVTLLTPAELDYEAPEGKQFSHWRVCKDNAQDPNPIAKHPGDEITITYETYIIAVWEDIPAPEVENYSVSIGDVMITELNYTDVFGDGKVSFDPESRTLTLNGFDYNGYGINVMDSAVAIGSKFDLTIELIGKSSIKLQQNPESDVEMPTVGILLMNGNLTMCGSGSLDIEVNNVGIMGGNFGIVEIDGPEITIDMPETTLDVASCAIAAHASFRLKEGSIKINSAQYGIYIFEDDGESKISGGSLEMSVGIAGGFFTTVDQEENYQTLPLLPVYDDATVMAATDRTGAGAEEYNAENLGTYKYLSIGTGSHQHTYGDVLNGKNESGHWHYCTDPACPDVMGSIKNFAPHTPAEDDGDCTTAVLCTECSKIAIAAKAEHVDSDENGKCDFCEYEMPAQNPEIPENPKNPEIPETPENPSGENDGLGAGAIVGIVIGSVAVVGIGGFALFWFVIKKKSFADLIAVFKKK